MHQTISSQRGPDALARAPRRPRSWPTLRPAPLPAIAIALLLLVAALTLLLTDGPDGRFLVDPPRVATVVSGAGFPKTLHDPIGRAILLPAPPTRIASAVLASDEILAALVPVARIVSITSYVDDASLSAAAGTFPPEIQRNFGGTEELLATQPDLAVLASYSDAVTVRLLLRSGVPVLRLPTPTGFAAIAEAITLLGAAVGAPVEADALIADMDARLAAVTRRVAGRSRPLVLYYGAGGFTAGPGSLVDEMIGLAGGDNLARVAGLGAHSRISAELAIALQPDVLLVSGWQHGQAPEAQLLTTNPAWRLVPAIANGRVHTVHGAWLTSASHAAVRGVEVIADLLHPPPESRSLIPDP